VRAILDSRHGRHFADSVQDQLYGGKDLGAALEAAIDQWMGWTIGRHTSPETGIPKGMPYLTGFVINEGLMAEGRWSGPFGALAIAALSAGYRPAPQRSSIGGRKVPTRSTADGRG